MKRDLDISEKRFAYVAGCADYVATIQEALDIYEKKH